MTGTAVPAAGAVVVVVLLFLEVVVVEWDKSDIGTAFVALLGDEEEGMQKHGKRRWRSDGFGGDGWVFAGSEDGCGCWVDWGVVVGAAVGMFVDWAWEVVTAVAVEESAAKINIRNKVGEQKRDIHTCFFNCSRNIRSLNRSRRLGNLRDK